MKGKRMGRRGVADGHPRSHKECTMPFRAAHARTRLGTGVWWVMLAAMIALLPINGTQKEPAPSEHRAATGAGATYRAATGAVFEGGDDGHVLASILRLLPERLGPHDQLRPDRGGAPDAAEKEPKARGQGERRLLTSRDPLADEHPPNVPASEPQRQGDSDGRVWVKGYTCQLQRALRGLQRARREEDAQAARAQGRARRRDAAVDALEAGGEVAPLHRKGRSRCQNVASHEPISGQNRGRGGGGGPRSPSVVVYHTLNDLYLRTEESTPGLLISRRPGQVRKVSSRQLLYRNVQRFRGGLVLKARRILYQSTLGLRVKKKKKKGLLQMVSPFGRDKVKAGRARGRAGPLPTRVSRS